MAIVRYCTYVHVTAKVSILKANLKLETENRSLRKLEQIKRIDSRNKKMSLTMESPLRQLNHSSLNGLGKRRRREHNDRFIPNRAAMDNRNNMYEYENSPNAANASVESKNYKELLKSQLGIKKQRVLSFHNTAAPAASFDAGFVAEPVIKKASSQSFRYVPKSAIRVLDAPDVSRDFYVNVTDWSADNILAVGLGSTLYLWNGENGATEELCTLEDADVTSVRFNKDSEEILAVGNDDGETLLFDVEAQKSLRSLHSHEARVSCLDWNGHLITTGGKDCSIVNHDIRVKDSVVSVLSHHSGEVCSLQWDSSGNRLAAGSNDDNASIFDHRANKLQHLLLGHCAAVKGLCWNPRKRNVLLTGGGRADKTIRTWNTTSGMPFSCTSVGGAVSGIHFNPYADEVVASVGSSVKLFTYPNMVQCKELQGHTDKILGLNLSPCSTTAASIGADEAIRFWKVFEEPVAVKAKSVTPEYAQFKLR